jgi:hypothetical protein
MKVTLIPPAVPVSRVVEVAAKWLVSYRNRPDAMFLYKHDAQLYIQAQSKLFIASLFTLEEIVGDEQDDD